MLLRQARSLPLNYMGQDSFHFIYCDYCNCVLSNLSICLFALTQTVPFPFLLPMFASWKWPLNKTVIMMFLLKNIQIYVINEGLRSSSMNKVERPMSINPSIYILFSAGLFSLSLFFFFSIQFDFSSVFTSYVPNKLFSNS